MKRFDQINVIPFIDIMLVLLAIVLTTATFIAKGMIPMELPKTSDELAAAETTPHEISVLKDGSLFLDNEAVTLERLSDSLQGSAKDTPITLRVDAQAPFQAFIVVINRLKRDRFSQVAIVAEPSG
ncbi:MAG TPA: biopolymer transporter ExbD [Chromatiaceae bacterium]|nr:biopolymer transporter ExbD [Chromatiaceae bacterium]